MENKPIHILLVDDDEDDFVLAKDILDEIERFNYTLVWEVNYQEARRRIFEEHYDVCLIDYRLGENDGISLISEAISKGIPWPFILLTGKGDQHIDMRAMREGAADYLVKDEINPQMMERSIRYALNNSKTLKLIKEGEQKFRQLFERSVDGIYICDSDNNLLDINPALSHLFGYSIEEIVTMKMSCFFANKEDFDRFAERVKLHSEVRNFETLMVTKSGEELNCQLNSITRTDSLNKPIGFQGIIRDITLFKRAEKNLLIAEKLSLSGKIARSVAHEVRNPLTNVSLATAQLRDEITDSNEELDYLINIIDKNAERISGLITDLLNSSKPKSLVKKDYSVNALVKEALELVQDRFTLKGMSLVTNLDPNIEPILLDHEQLEVALVNIMVNALEAMEVDKGELKVATIDKSNSVLIKITDNGSGISSDDMKRLFDPFYTKKSGGMGLGLTSTLNVIQSHGGSIDVSSQLGEGTIFTIILPK